MAAGAIPLVAGARLSAQVTSPSGVAAAASETGTVDPELQRRKQQARTHFDKGFELEEQQVFEQALAEFVKSREIFPTRIAALNQARCLHELHRFADALALFDEIRASSPEELTPAQARYVETERLELIGLVAVVFVSSNVSGAHVFIDGRERGRAPSASGFTLDPGTHWVLVEERGFESQRMSVELAPGESRMLEAKLVAVPAPPAPDTTPRGPERERLPRAQAVRRKFSLAASAGLALSSTLDGDAERSCGRTVLLASGARLPSCGDKSAPFGLLVGVRLGYYLGPNLSVDALLGYAKLGRSLLRRLDANAQDITLSTENLRDELQIRAPLAALGASYHAFERFPASFGMSLGLMRGRLTASDRGDFSGVAPPPSDAGPVSGALNLREDAQTFTAAFIAPELQFGVRVRSRLRVSAGLALWIVLPAGTRRVGDIWRQAAVRRAALENPLGDATRTLTLPDENALGTWVIWVPSLTLAWEV